MYIFIYLYIYIYISFYLFIYSYISFIYIYREQGAQRKCLLADSMRKSSLKQREETFRHRSEVLAVVECFEGIIFLPNLPELEQYNGRVNTFSLPPNKNSCQAIPSMPRSLLPRIICVIPLGRSAYDIAPWVEAPLNGNYVLSIAPPTSCILFTSKSHDCRHSPQQEEETERHPS